MKASQHILFCIAATKQYCCGHLPAVQATMVTVAGSVAIHLGSVARHGRQTAQGAVSAVPCIWRAGTVAGQDRRHRNGFNSNSNNGIPYEVY